MEKLEALNGGRQSARTGHWRLFSKADVDPVQLSGSSRLKIGDQFLGSAVSLGFLLRDNASPFIMERTSREFAVTNVGPNVGVRIA
jgi:hypothetical protein